MTTMRTQAEGLLLELEERLRQLYAEADQLVGREVIINNGKYIGRRAFILSVTLEIHDARSLQIWFFLRIPKINHDKGTGEYVWGPTDSRRAYGPDELELVA